MYTGNWLKSQRRVDPRATHLPTPTAEHGRDVPDQYHQEHQAPPSPDWGDVDFARTVVQTPGLVLDTPDRAHGSRGRYGTYRDQAERQASQAPGHEGQDRGWVRQTYRAAEFQDDTTRYLESTWTGNGSHAPPPEALQRGINSLPQNNPEVHGYDPGGFRRGVRNFRFIDRKNKLDHRVYTAQQLLAREIRVPYPQPAQNGTGIMKTSPFGSMARVRETITQTPGVFRHPPGLTESVLADQTAPPADGGIATDGMWTVL